MTDRKRQSFRLSTLKVGYRHLAEHCRKVTVMKHKYVPVAQSDYTDTVARAYVTYGNVDRICGCLTHRQATSLAGLATMVGDDSLMNCACVVVDVPPVNERGQAQFLTLFQSAGAVSRNARRRFFYMYHYPCYPVFLDME